MGKFFRKKNKLNEKRKERRTKKGILSGLNHLWKEMSKPAGIVLFNQIWESEDLTKLEINASGIRKKIVKAITNKYKKQMLGYKYQLIYFHLNSLIQELRTENINNKNFVLVKKDLITFYKKPLSYDPNKKYPGFRNRLKIIFRNIEHDKYLFSDIKYLEKIIFPNLHDCEFQQKTSFLKMWGLT